MPQPGSTASRTIIAYVKYFDILNPQTALHGPGDSRIFRQLYLFAGGDLAKMAAWGVTIYPEETSLIRKEEACAFTKYPTGFYLIVSTNNQEGPSNNYCPVNPQWVPEWNICTSPSIDGAGGNDPWWSQEGKAQNWDCRKNIFS